MPAYPLRRAVAIAGLIFLAACGQSKGSWEKPGTSGEDRLSDIHTCREYARQRMNSRELRREEERNDRATDDAATGQSDDLAGLRRIMEADRYRRQDQFYDDCMRERGYRLEAATSDSDG